MKQKRVLAFVLVCLMLLMQVPITAFAENATAGTTTNTLTPDILENGAEDIKWSWIFNYSGSAYIDSVRISDGKLPDNVSLNSPSWTWFSISGTPKKEGTYSFTIEVKNKNGEVLTKDYTLVIERDYPLEIVADHLTHGYVGSEYKYTDIYLTYNRTEGNKWELEDADGKGLPEGLTINEATGDISWPSPIAGKYNLKITVTRKEKTISKVLKLIVETEGGCKHLTPTKTTGKVATCKENGTRDYWYCDDCEHYFYDADCTEGDSEYLGKIYTTAFHSNTNNDNQCDTCGKTMPIFKKVTTNDEITSYGMYLIVTKIGEKYYTLKTPTENYTDSIEAVEITQNADGTFSYPKANAGVMILKTSAAAASGGELDAGSPRYGLSTTIDGVPCVLDSSYGIQMYKYEDAAKYGNYIKLTEDGNVEIADVYSEYWGNDESGKYEKGGSGGSGILSAYEETVDEGTKRYFSFVTTDGVTPNSVALYKLAYAETTTNGTSYTVSDAPLSTSQSAVTNELIDFGNNKFSVVGGIGDALTKGAVEDIITENSITTNELTVQTYAAINATSKETAEGSADEVTAITYDVKPYIKIKNAEGDELKTAAVSDNALNGIKMTVTLCVGSMEPAQIIHYKSDNTKEYFYDENSDEVKNGAKSFTLTQDYENGNLVSFEIDSFSEIKISETAKAEEHSTKTTVNGNNFIVNGNNVNGYTVILALYKEDGQGNSQLVDCKTAIYDGNAITFTTNTDYTSAKVMVWNNLTNIEPVTGGEIVALGE